MLKIIIRQTNWGIIGAIFGFSVGFFVKIYLIDIVGLDAWGKYVIAQIFSSTSETLLSIGIPFVIIKFIPSFVVKNKDKASRLASIFIKYAFLVGSIYLVIIYFAAPSINHYIYSDVRDLNWILFVMCIHVPISMLFGVVVSLYRSILKIKEIVLYGTLISVSVRAILTFVIFQYTADISHFILIEVFTQILALFILLYLFNKNEFSLFRRSTSKEVTDDVQMVSYGKKMFLNSIIAFISGQVLSIIISIKLPSVDVGAYHILLTLTGLTTFLLANLNKVIAPAITQLYNENKILELDFLYKRTTFIINMFSIPLGIIIATFADEILGLYTNEMLAYKNHLFCMLLGAMSALAAGSSGIFLIMAGLEKQNLYIQIIRSIFLIVFSLWLIPLMGLKIVVILYSLALLLITVIELFYIKKHINISPFSKELVVLLMSTIIVMYFAMNQNIHFEMYHFIIIPVVVYLGLFSIVFKSFKRLIKELL